MSNKISNQLHELIKALSPSEKRYFRIYAQRHQTSDKTSYVALFDLIDAQESYDEEQVKKKSSAKSVVKFTSIAKNRLYNQVLKSLDAYHSGKSAADEVNRQIHYAEILYQKALYLQCERLLHSAGKTAEKFEYLPGLLQVLKWQKRLAEIHQFETNPELSIQAIFEKEQDALSELGQVSELWKNKSLLFSRLFTQGQLRDKAEANKLLPEAKTLLSKISITNKSFDGEYLRNHSLSAIYFGLNDYFNSHTYLKANYDLMMSRIHMTLEDPSIYLATLTNLVYVTAKLNLLDQTASYLAQSKNLPIDITNALTADLKMRHEINLYSLELAICYLSGESMKARTLIPEVAKWLNSRSQKLSQVRKASFYTSLANLCFMIGDYRQALKWNNELLNTVSSNKAEDQYRFAEMHHILIHYELGNFSTALNATKRLQRNLDGMKNTLRFDDAFMNLMNSLTDSKIESLQNDFADFRAICEKVENDPYEKAIMEFFDFSAWSESKLRSIPFAEVLRERAPTKDML